MYTVIGIQSGEKVSEQSPSKLFSETMVIISKYLFVLKENFGAFAESSIIGNHLILTSEHTAKLIEQKARKVLEMLKRGGKFMSTQLDVLSILEKLKQKE